MVVENIGGAGGSLRAAAVARAQPDGYKILLGGTLLPSRSGAACPYSRLRLGCIQCKGLNLFFATHRLNERLGAMLSA